MNTYLKLLFFFLVVSLVGSLEAQTVVKIDRKAVVARHNIENTGVDSLASLTVGNGAFAYTVDITGMQSFPEYYKNGVSLGTQSEWGWNNFPNKGNYLFSETLKYYDFNHEGRKAGYSVQNKEPVRNYEASEYFRVNPHRLQLGNIGLELYLKNGRRAAVEDIKGIEQTLDLWTGIITSQFEIDGSPVRVSTAAYQQADGIGVKVISPLVKQKRIKVFIRYPYPTGKFLDEAVNYENQEEHTSDIISQSGQSAVIGHQLPGTQYFTSLSFSKGNVRKAADHYFVYEPAAGLEQFECTVAFAPKNEFRSGKGLYDSVAAESIKGWSDFWNSGAAVDFEGSTDPRASELERRVVLSQYLTRVQCGGSNPPQETGLTFNSWYGKPHTEMHWWHGVHYALWGRPAIMEKTLDYYFRTYDKA